MSRSIKVSKKHGVNPTLGVCFWCGKETGEIGLLGKLPEDKEAPRRSILSYEPCNECKEKFKEGVLLMEATPTPNIDGQPPMQKDVYPTGRILVIKEEAFNRMFDVEMKAGEKAFAEKELFEKLLNTHQKEDSENEEKSN